MSKLSPAMNSFLYARSDKLHVDEGRALLRRRITPEMFAEYRDYEPVKLVLSRAQADDFLAAGLIKEGDYIIRKPLPLKI